MTISIRPLHPVFVGEVSGVDITRPLAREEVAAIDAGMDRYAVLVFRDQRLPTNSSSRSAATSANWRSLAAPASASRAKLRLDPAFADVSNLDKDDKTAGARRPAAAVRLGNRLWHSDSSFRAMPAKYSLLSGRIVVDKGGNTEFADMRAAYDALDDGDQGRNRGSGLRTLADLSRASSSASRPVGRRTRDDAAGAAAPGAHASGDRPQVAVSRLAHRHHRRLAGAGGACLHPRPDGARHAAAVRLRARVAAMGSGDVGQPRRSCTACAATTTPSCATCAAPRLAAPR